MYLKSIEVYGFKSFANKITFEFKNGITGIVGPNGSGKSNVADAVRWVLGEQSAKQLRGAKMEDVIFSGTESRKPLGSAYVAITLDNSDHSLSIAYDEVTVARRVYRSGESEYSINGTTCRLKDITNLFLDTGIGKEGYSIIGQGQIDKILSGKPEERRELFDEAAGIVKYKKNKSATEKALEGERQNLYRVTDILSELEGQLAPLKKQSEKAKEYLSYKERQKQLDLTIFFLEVGELRKKKEEVQRFIQRNTEELEQVKQQYESMKMEYDTLEHDLEQNRQLVEQVQHSMQETSLQREKMEGEINVFKEQMNTIKNDERHLEENKKRVTAQLEKKEQEKKEYHQEKVQLEQEAHTLTIEIEAIKKQEEENNQAIQLLLTQIEEEKKTIISSMNEVASLKGKLQRYDTMAEQVTLRKSELNQRLLHYQSEETRRKEEWEQLSLREQDGKEQQRLLKARMEQKEQLLLELQSKIEYERQREGQLQKEYHVSESRLETVRNLTERYEGYGNSIKKVMEQKNKIQGIHGVVADLIQTEKQFETAIEIALGGSIQNIVTDQEETAKYLIRYLKENKLGRATFLPLTSVKGKASGIKEQVLQEKGVIGIASSLVKADRQYQGILQHLLGRIVIVDTIDHAIALARTYQQTLRIVTLDGESLSPGGAMTGGAFRNSSNLLGRRRELDELEAKKMAVIKEQQEVKEELKRLQLQKNEQKQTIEAEQAKYQQQELELHTIQVKRSSNEKQGEELQIQKERIARESKELEQQVIEIKENQKKLEEQTNQYEEKRSFSETKVKQLELEVTKVTAQKHSKSDRYHTLTMDQMSLKQKLDFLQVNEKRVRMEEQELLKQKEQYEQQLTTSNHKTKTLLHDIQMLEEAVKQSENTLELIKQQLQEKEEERQAITTSHKALFEKRETLLGQINQFDKEEYRLKSQQEKIEERIHGQTSYIWDEYEMTYQAVAELIDATKQEQTSLKAELSKIKNQMKALGDVNVNAIEDYKTVSERFTFLSAQRDDIIKAEQNLLQIIQELDVVMRQQFEEKFAEIQRMFQNVFQELFGGGKATLELIEGEDVLEAGIRIVSQPPGKKLQNMMQLSGGEKALTAIALLFAIQSLKPSPFCLLDEIEAALDDSNVDRFANYLHKLTKDTQFIVITHRRGTMVAADVLYGITMQEKGVSALVSVNLIENELEQ